LGIARNPQSPSATQAPFFYSLIYRPLRCHSLTSSSTENTSAAFRVCLVGSRASAILLRFRLAVAPRFLWECLISRTVSWVPVPAPSNPSCRFPAMGLPVCFRLRVMGLSRLAGLSVVTMVGEAGNLCRVPASRKATSYSTFSNRILFSPGPASDVPEPSSLPSL
jgi:hypothetical protein